MKKFLIALLISSMLIGPAYAGGKADELPELNKEQAAYIEGYALGTWELNIMYGPMTPTFCYSTWDGVLWHDEIVEEARWLLSLMPKRERNRTNIALLARRAGLLAWGCGYEYP